jgi:hypothetical protein
MDVPCSRDAFEAARRGLVARQAPKGAVASTAQRKRSALCREFEKEALNKGIF